MESDMLRRISLVALALGLSVVGVAAPAAAGEGTVVCTLSMPPECKIGAPPAVVCTASMPPECRID